MSTFASRDGTMLNEMLWPASPARAGVALVHGYGEHIGRYDQVGRALAARGFSTHGVDLRGHGQSAGVRAHVNRFDDYLDDIAGVIARCQAELGGKPLFLVAHSNGGLAATEYVLKRGSDGLAGLVLSSPYFGLKLKVPAAKVFVAKIMSGVMPKLSLPSGLKGADCTRDPELAKIYDADPLNNKNATARWFTESMAAQEHVAAHAAELKLPLLMMQGSADRLADPLVSKATFEKFTSTDKTLQYLEGQFHEVFNEPAEIRKKNIDALCDWLESHVTR